MSRFFATGTDSESESSSEEEQIVRAPAPVYTVRSYINYSDNLSYIYITFLYIITLSEPRFVVLIA